MAGTVIDADGTRVLHQTGDGLVVTSLATGAATTIWSGAAPEEAFVTPQGALFVVATSDFYVGEIMEWREGGPAVSLGFRTRRFEPSRVIRAGLFLLWAAATSTGEIDLVLARLVRHDLATGAEVIVTQEALDYDLAADGDVVFSAPFDAVARYRDEVGVETLATELPMCCAYHPQPRTDGTRVVWREGVDRWPNMLVVWDGAASEIGLANGRGYLLSGPWVTYTRAELYVLGQQQGEIRAYRFGPLGPDGVEEVVPLGAGVEVLLPDGTIVGGLGVGGSRYLMTPGLAPVPVGPGGGRAVLRDGRILVLDGSNVLEVIR